MQYKRGGLRNGAKQLCLMMPRPCPTAGQERAKSRGKAKALADRWWTKGMARWTHGRQGLEAQPKWTQGRTQVGHAETWQTHGGHIVVKVWRRGQSGHKANTRRTQGRHMADTWRPKRTQGKHKGGQMPDMRQTHGGGGQASGTRPEHIAASPSFLRKNPTINCLGNTLLGEPLRVGQW